jgi:hypothetical protein
MLDNFDVKFNPALPLIYIVYDEASETEDYWIYSKPIFLHRNAEECPFKLTKKMEYRVTKLAALV